MEIKEYCPVCGEHVEVKLGSYVTWAYFYSHHLDPKTTRDCPNSGKAERSLHRRGKAPEPILQPELPDLW